MSKPDDALLAVGRLRAELVAAIVLVPRCDSLVRSLTPELQAKCAESFERAVAALRGSVTDLSHVLHVLVDV